MDACLSPVERLIVLSCRRDAPQRLGPAEVTLLADPALRRGVLQAASRHRVVGLTVAGLLAAAERQGMAEGWVGELRGEIGALRRRAAAFLLKRDHLLGLLLARGITTVVLKGALLATEVYADPSARDLADLDLLIRLGQLEATIEALESAGYRRAHAELDRSYRDHHFHLPFVDMSGHYVEIHWDLAPPGAAFHLRPEAVFTHARPGPRGLLPALEHLLLHIVLQNLQESFSRLSRTVDIDRMLASGGPALRPELLAREARASNMASATALSLHLAARLMGTSVPSLLARQLRPGLGSRTHLACMRPVDSMLRQRWCERFSRRTLAQFWLLPGWRPKIAGLGKALQPSAFSREFEAANRGTAHGWRLLLKLVALQLVIYASSARSLLTGTGRAQIRFWSNQASSSDRL